MKPSEHFVLGWMRKWDYDASNLHETGQEPQVKDWRHVAVIALFRRFLSTLSIPPAAHKSSGNHHSSNGGILMFEKIRNIAKVGKNRYEAYTRHKGRTRKIIFTKEDKRKEIFIIAGAEGR